MKKKVVSWLSIVLIIILMISVFISCDKKTTEIVEENLLGLKYDLGTGAIIGYDRNLSSTLVIPKEIEGVTITEIALSAFSDCNILTRISIPDSITNVGYAAFNCCTNLTSIILPDSVTDIGYLAFYNCTSLKNITFSNSITKIGHGTFYNCTSLTRITIPDSVTTIMYGAFANCTSLTRITIPNSVTNIGYGAFSDCSNLIEITYSGTISQWNSLPKGEGWDSGTGDYVIRCVDGDIL